MADKFEKIGKVSSASVEKGSGKPWAKWIEILEEAGARGWSHQEIVAFLKKKYKLTPWWQQGVAVGFEIATGRRVEGQNIKGEFTVTASRTFPLSSKAAWNYLWSDEGLRLWLKPLSEFDIKKGAVYESEHGTFGEVRTMKAGLRARLTWQDADWAKPTILQVYVIPRPKRKCIVVLNHEGLKEARLRLQLQEQWKSALADLLAAAPANG